jgi:hypothetical protein
MATNVSTAITTTVFAAATSAAEDLTLTHARATPSACSQ